MKNKIDRCCENMNGYIEKQPPQDWKERFIKKFAVKKPYWSNELKEGVGVDELVDFIEVELKT